MILIKDYQDKYYLVNEIEQEENPCESCNKCDFCDNPEECEKNAEYTDERYHQYWDSSNWKKIYCEDYQEDFKYTEIETLEDEELRNVKICKEEENYDYFLLVSYPRFATPDRVYFLSLKEKEDIDANFEDYID